MRWEDLIKYDNLCNASPLTSLVFCCSVEKKCPFRDKALKILGISKKEYTRIKEENKIEAKGTCYGNLAYCCSLNSACESRDKALKELNISHSEYLKYKYKILTKLIPENKLQLAENTKVIYMLAFEAVSLDNTDLGYRGIAFGNPELTDNLVILNYQEITPKIDEKVKDSLKKEKFLSIRISKSTYNKLFDLAKINSCSISDLVRDAVEVYLSLQESVERRKSL